MGNIISHLQPKRVWEFFEEICQIPRPSGKEDKILKYLIDFATKNNLQYSQDKVGNLIIRKGAKPGYEMLKSVVLQSHVDMVCEKNAGVDHNFESDPIKPRIDGVWVRAEGTTLGADDGIGVAVQLAILESDEIKHGAIECLFTVEEETGLTGAFGLEPGFVKSRILLNLDSEDEGELFIGCAGGVDTSCSFTYERVNTEIDHQAYRISVTGLKGGHSGDDINKGRGNAIKVLIRLLWRAAKDFELRLAEIDGGNLRNAIAREAFATATIPTRYAEKFVGQMKNLAAEIKLGLKTNEPALQISITPVVMPRCLIDLNTQNNLINALYACPHGVITMSADMPGLVESSTNLASISMTPGEILVGTSQRSSVESGMNDIANMVASVFTLAGAKVKSGEGYPGWKPNMDSEILAVMKTTYEQLFGKQPKVLAIHAGLECGLIGEKYPGMDMISYGPTIKNAHSPDEGILIETVDMFWKHTLETLKQIPEGG
jgi:dipeptidase D